MLTGEVGVGGTVELRLQEVFDELCPSEEEDPWPDRVNWEGLGDLVDMEIEQFVKIGGKRKGEAQTAPPAKKAPKLSRGKEQVFLRSKVLSNPHLFLYRSLRNAHSARSSSARMPSGGTTCISCVSFLNILLFRLLGCPMT